MDIHDMLKRIPSVPVDKIVKYNRAIGSKLTVYEKLRDVALLLELALWKARIAEHDMVKDGYLSVKSKAEHRMDCGKNVVIPKVLAFLLCTDESVDDDNEDEPMVEESDEDDSELDEQMHFMGGLVSGIVFIR